MRNDCEGRRRRPEPSPEPIPCERERGDSGVGSGGKWGGVGARESGQNFRGGRLGPRRPATAIHPPPVANGRRTEGERSSTVPVAWESHPCPCCEGDRVDGLCRDPHHRRHACPRTSGLHGATAGVAPLSVAATRLRTIRPAPSRPRSGPMPTAMRRRKGKRHLRRRVRCVRARRRGGCGVIRHLDQRVRAAFAARQVWTYHLRVSSDRKSVV